MWSTWCRIVEWNYNYAPKPHILASWVIYDLQQGFLVVFFHSKALRCSSIWWFSCGGRVVVACFRSALFVLRGGHGAVPQGSEMGVMWVVWHCFLGILGGCVAMDATTDLYCIYLYLLYKHVSTDVFIVYIYIFLLTTDVKSQVYVTIIANGDCKVFMVWSLVG